MCEVACEVARKDTREVAQFGYGIVREVARREVENPNPKTSRKVDVKLFLIGFHVFKKGITRKINGCTSTRTG